MLIKALTRIYKLIAKNDKKKTKSKDLLAYYHDEIFKNHIDDKQHEAIIDIISNSDSGNNTGELLGITLDGCISLNQTVIQHDQFHYVLRFLRYFNYDDGLIIQDSVCNCHYNDNAYEEINEKLEEVFKIYSNNNTIDLKVIETYSDLKLKKVQLSKDWYKHSWLPR